MTDSKTRGTDPVRAWMEKAEEDFRSAQILEAAEPPALSAACFHCQQAAEKYLKAVLVKENVEPPRTHDLSALLDLTPLSEESVYDAAEFLNPFAVSIRYPSSDGPHSDPRRNQRSP